MENQENRPASQIDAATTQDEAIEAYLDRLCGPLKRVSPTQRAEIRREVQAHLRMLIARQDHAPDAVQKALSQFGEPEKVGRTMARRAHWDSVRLTWRAARWTTRLSFFWLLLVGFWGAAITVEFCRWMQWGHHLTAWIMIGPLLPLAMGLWWGTRATPSRWGYLFIGLMALVLAAFLPIPGQFAHADLDRVGQMDLSGLVRFTYMVLWLWISAAACGVAHILFAQSANPDTITA